MERHPCDAGVRPLGILVPCVSSHHLGEKLLDLRKLAPLTRRIVVCFNGPQEEYSEVVATVRRYGSPSTAVCYSPPFNKNLALSSGLGSVDTNSVLYTDVDCLIRGTPDMSSLTEEIKFGDVLSFLVLRGPTNSPLIVRAAQLRRRLFSRAFSFLGLYYLCVRGGGYVAGDFSAWIDAGISSDDLFYPAEYAAHQGGRIVASESLVFYETVGNSRRYADKLPRLVFGSFQCFNRSRSVKVKLSLVLQKLAKYALVGLSPLLVAGTLWATGLPVWPVGMVAFGARVLVRTWEGIYRGLTDMPPRW